MKNDIKLIPVLAEDATHEQLTIALDACRKPILRKLAKELGKARAKRTEAEENVSYILAKAETDLALVVKTFADLAKERNEKLALINLAISFTKERFRQQINSWLSQEKTPAEALELALADLDTALEEEVEEYALNKA